MRKITLLLLVKCFLLTQLQAQITMETIKAELEKSFQQYSAGVQMRDSTLDLYIDTLHCMLYTAFPDYHLDNENFDGWTYDAENREIEKRSHLIYYSSQGNVEQRSKINSYYDAEGRLASQLSSSDASVPGVLTPVSLTEYTYNTANLVAVSTISFWTGANWALDNRTLSEYDPEGREIENIQQNFNTINWVNAARTVHQYNPDGNVTFTQTSSWENNAWEPGFQYDAVFDTNGTVQQEIFQFAFGGQPLSFSDRNLYYATNGRIDSVFRFDWDLVTMTWIPREKEIRVYDAADVWIESLYYNWDGIGSYYLSNRNVYDYVDNLMGFPIQNNVNQVWDPATSMFLNKSKNEYSLVEIPGNYAAGYTRFSVQNPAGSGLWQVFYNCDFGFNTVYTTKTQQPVRAAACTMPNPYTTGQWIQCEQLNDNFTYVASVYALDGRRVYARVFRGGEGWSIEKNLPEGMYLVVLTHNDKPVWQNKVVVRH